MTRKDYVAAARVLHERKPLWNAMPCFEIELAKWDEIVAGIADMFAADNARFERLRFVAACSKGI